MLFLPSRIRYLRIRTRFLAIFLPLLVLGLPTTARALGGDLYFGYSRLGANTFYPNVNGLNGWEAAGEVNVLPFIGAEADIAHYGVGAASNVQHSTTFLFGPRLTLGPSSVHIFVHGLFGAEHSSNAGNIFSANAFTVAAGGGVDFKILPFFAWRVGADYIDAPTVSPSSGSHDRFTTGLVFRF